MSRPDILVAAGSRWRGRATTAGAVATRAGLHGIGGYRHTDADLRKLRERCRFALGEGRRPVYGLFDNVSMLDDARAFRALLDARSGP